MKSTLAKYVCELDYAASVLDRLLNMELLIQTASEINGREIGSVASVKGDGDG
jgi:hypothetical protein